MEPLPKIIRERLQAAADGEHPDADQLTAFAEQGLTARERNTVAAHLATCSECRQVLALATPDAAATVPATVKPAPQSWFRWPVLRWGALAACVAIVGAAVVIGFRPSPKNTAALETYVVSDRQASAPAAQNEPVAAAEARHDRAASEERPQSPPPARAKAPSKNQVTAAKTDKEALDQIGVSSAGSSAERKDETADLGSAVAEKKVAPQNTDNLAANRVVPAPRSTPQVFGRNVVPPQNVPVPATESVAVAPAPPPAPQYSTLAKSKPAASPAAKKAAAAPVANHGLLETAASAPGALMPDLKTPKWSLSGDGLPQRSFDSGSTWEKIQVDHKAGFRALSATGMDVWVGGASGLLYHSSDVGLHWTRIIPVANNSTLSGDITHIQFSDALRGTVNTADGETWITSDGGKTWTSGTN